MSKRHSQHTNRPIKRSASSTAPKPAITDIEVVLENPLKPALAAQSELMRATREQHEARKPIDGAPLATATKANEPDFNGAARPEERAETGAPPAASESVPRPIEPPKPAITNIAQAIQVLGPEVGAALARTGLPQAYWHNVLFAIGFAYVDMQWPSDAPEGQRRATAADSLLFAMVALWGCARELKPAEVHPDFWALCRAIAANHEARPSRPLDFAAPIGTPVAVTLEDGRAVQTKTFSSPFRLAAGDFVMLEDSYFVGRPVKLESCQAI